jgi:integrase
MGRERKPAHIRKWRGSYYLVFTDYGVQPYREKRLSCASLDAHDDEARKALLKEYRSKEVNVHAEANRRGGFLGYDTKLIDAIDDYLSDVKRRVKVREANPVARAGLAASSGRHLEVSLGYFKQWLAVERLQALTTGDFEPRNIRRYRDWLASTPTRRGNSELYRSAATLNFHTVALRTAVNWVSDLRPPRFPDIDNLRRALRPQPVRNTKQLALTPEVLKVFLAEALSHDDPERVLNIERERHGRVEVYRQKKAVMSATPVSRLFVLLALTGARVTEVLHLKWADIDLPRGRLRIYAQKTGYFRILPLVNAPEGEISPTLLQLLREWKLQAGEREYVLPYDPAATEAPVFPKSAWERVNRNAKLPRIGPQMLRRTFTSYCASLGVPAAVAALWQGHGANVAEVSYRQQLLERGEGSIEEAMGLAPLLHRMKQGRTSEAAEA